MKHPLVAVAALALSLAVPASAALAQDTRTINVWGAHFDLPAAQGGDVLLTSRSDGARNTDPAQVPGTTRATTAYTSGRSAQTAATAAQ